MSEQELDQLEQEIALAESHIQNAKDWIKACREGRDHLLPYHVSEALDEAAATLFAATVAED